MFSDEAIKWLIVDVIPYVVGFLLLVVTGVIGFLYKVFRDMDKRIENKVNDKVNNYGNVADNKFLKKERFYILREADLKSIGLFKEENIKDSAEIKGSLKTIDIKVTNIESKVNENTRDIQSLKRDYKIW